jgi:hypothetical protein
VYHANEPAEANEKNAMLDFEAYRGIWEKAQLKPQEDGQNRVPEESLR